jgi:hypothetical protein
LYADSTDSEPPEVKNAAFWHLSRKHDLTAGGRVEYVTTGPEGDRHPGVVGGAGRRPPCSLDFEDELIAAGVR